MAELFKQWSRVLQTNRLQGYSPSNEILLGVKNRRSGAAIREFQLFAPTRFDLWGVEHCICPEVYTAIHVKPGEKQSWWRVWQFIGE